MKSRGKERMWSTHFAITTERWGVSHRRRGDYKRADPACGAFIADNSPGTVVTDRSKVTCGRCRRSKAFKA